MSRATVDRTGSRYTMRTAILHTGTSLSGEYGAPLQAKATAHFSIASVNSGPAVLVDQPDSGGGSVVISVPVKVDLNSGANSITFGSGQNSECRSFSAFRHLSRERVAR